MIDAILLGFGIAVGVWLFVSLLIAALFAGLVLYGKYLYRAECRNKPDRR